METQVAPLAGMLDLNTDLLLNCLDGLSDAEARMRDPLARYLAGVRTIDEISDWPSVDEIRSAWRAVSAHLQEALASLAGTDLAQPNAHRFPLADSTLLGLIAFLAQHDSYHLGQLAFLRRQLGKPAMSYAREARPASPAGAA